MLILTIDLKLSITSQEESRDASPLTKDVYHLVIYSLYFQIKPPADLIFPLQHSQMWLLLIPVVLSASFADGYSAMNSPSLEYWITDLVEAFVFPLLASDIFLLVSSVKIFPVLASDIFFLVSSERCLPVFNS